MTHNTVAVGQFAHSLADRRRDIVPGRWRLWVMGLLVYSGVTGAVLAADTTAPATKLEEIVVTAEKRSSTVQETPIV